MLLRCWFGIRKGIWPVENLTYRKSPSSKVPGIGWLVVVAFDGSGNGCSCSSSSMCVPAVEPLTSNRHHLSYDECLENKGRLQDCSGSIGSYHYRPRMTYTVLSGTLNLTQPNPAVEVPTDA